MPQAVVEVGTLDGSGQFTGATRPPDRVLAVAARASSPSRLRVRSTDATAIVAYTARAMTPARLTRVELEVLRLRRASP